MVRRRNQNARAGARRNLNVTPKRRAMPVAHEDTTVVHRQFMNNYTVSLNNLLTTSDSNYGNTYLSWNGNGVPLEFRSQFRRIRLARVQIYAQCTQSVLGPMQTIADSETTQVTSAVNTSNNKTFSSTSIRDLPSARTISLTKGLKLISDFRPQLGVETTPFIIYNKNQWLSAGDVSTHWRGFNMMAQNIGGGHVYTDPAKMQKIYLLVREHWEFQGRISNLYDTSLTQAVLQPETETADAIHENTPYDLTISPLDLKNGLLTGSMHPYIINGINIGNIGGSVQPAQLIGVEFRLNSSPDVRYKVVASESAFIYCVIV